MTHGEKMARAALQRWLKLAFELDTCAECTPSTDQCLYHSPKIKKLIKDTKMLLSTGPN